MLFFLGHCLCGNLFLVADRTHWESSTEPLQRRVLPLQHGDQTIDSWSHINSKHSRAKAFYSLLGKRLWTCYCRIGRGCGGLPATVAVDLWGSDAFLQQENMWGRDECRSSCQVGKAAAHFSMCAVDKNNSSHRQRTGEAYIGAWRKVEEEVQECLRPATHTTRKTTRHNLHT